MLLTLVSLSACDEALTETQEKKVPSEEQAFRGESPDAEAKPDLIVDQQVLKRDLQFDIVDPANDPCLLEENCLNGLGPRLVLRFSTRTSNIGSADFVIGNPANSPNYTFSPCHGHYHYYDYASYELVGQDNEVVVAGHKQGFALVDVGMIYPNYPNANSMPVYNAQNQGIQGGWYDEYSWALPCQWIDVTDVPPGNYLLKVEVNPSRLFGEASYINNTATVSVYIPDLQGE